MVDYVARDRRRESEDILTSTAIPSVPPLVINGLAVGTSLGRGYVKYGSSNVAVTGAAQSLRFQISRPHRILRVEFTQIVTSSGADDATGINITFNRFWTDLNAAKPNTSNNAIFSTNGNQAVSSVNFVGGIGYEFDQASYLINFTGQNNDTLIINLYVEFF